MSDDFSTAIIPSVDDVAISSDGDVWIRARPLMDRLYEFSREMNIRALEDVANDNDRGTEMWQVVALTLEDIANAIAFSINTQLGEVA